MSIARASAIMIVTLVASRVLGWLRLSVIGAHFGETPELDAFWAAFKIPDAIFGLVVAGALASAFGEVNRLSPVFRLAYMMRMADLMAAVQHQLVRMRTLRTVLTPGEELHLFHAVDRDG